MKPKTLKSYVRQTLALFKGDTDEILAEKNYRKAKAAIKGQISALEAKQIELEDKLAEAEEDLLKAKYPTVLILNSESYIKSIQIANNTLTEAKDNLEEVKEAIVFLEALDKEYDKVE